VTGAEPDTMDPVDDPQDPAAASPPEKRIGDRERREVDAQLRQAHDDGVLTLTEYDERVALCWAARSRGDLDALTRDLPDPEPALPATTRDTGSPPEAPPSRSRGRFLRAAVATVAVLAGVQIVTADDAVAVFGGRTVQVLPDQDRVEVSVLFGNVQVVVPGDARVDTEGVLVFGGTDCEAACSGTGTRVVTVDARGAFGSVDVVRQGARVTRGDRDGDDDDEDED
jgi:Domain of unknown function (DUF1707)